jgi:hypothetical protein
MIHLLVGIILSSPNPGLIQTRPTPVVSTRTVPLLVRAVKAIEDIGLRRWMTPSYRKALAKAALYAYRKTGVNPFLMLALSRMESDFRRLRLIKCKMRRGRQYCTGDCGVTQHYVYGSRSYVKRVCKRLAYDYKYSFLQSAKEIKTHMVWCRRYRSWDNNFWRCVLNQYNQGRHYRRQIRCWRKPRRRWGRCLFLSIYWKKVLCFKYGADRGITPWRRRRGRKRRWDYCRRFYWKWKVGDIPRKAYGLKGAPRYRP